MSIVINNIAVDLLPMQEGGYNGGAKQFILDLIKSLAEENRNVVFHCYSYSLMKRELNEHLKGDNIRVIIVTKLSKYLWNPYKSKILFCPFGSSSMPSRRLPILSILYDLQVKSYPQFFSRSDRKNREKQLNKIKRTATIIAISNFTKKEAVRHGFSKKKIHIIPINVNCRGENCESSTKARETEGKNIILYPANLWEHKNHELLFSAFAIAADRGLSPDISLVCTGYGETQRVNYLKSLINGIKQEGRIFLAGYVDNKTLVKLYRKSISMIFPSLYEGFGIPVIEAMSLGIPVCCSNTTALKEVSGDAAINFDPRDPSAIADVICRISSDHILRNSCREKGYLQASVYKNTKQMIYEYSEAINKTYLRISKS